MGKRTDINSILIVGSGPIVIGQACEFDYSGAQACKALKEEGYRVILINSNPATIMTDPQFADATYIEPLSVEIIEKIIEKERPDALLPTLGGQTALNLSLELSDRGVLDKYNVELIGAKKEAIRKGEDRKLFREAMMKIGLDMPKSTIVTTLEEGKKAAEEIGSYPLIIRPSFTLGGRGGGIAYNKEEYEDMLQQGLKLSPVCQVLVEECLLGWKEYEMEVIRDTKDQCVIICSIENMDPMGVHTGDSITVAPAMTLTDKEYQLMRDASFAVIREIGVETGGSNIQFAVNPANGRLVVIEMNPRVSRSSALASKATGFPIAKIAAKLAVGYTLDELTNDITKETPAIFEPSIDYVVTKIPRFTFEKFPEADSTLTSSMKSVGEAMAIGLTFKESFQKALRSLERGLLGFGSGSAFDKELPEESLIIANLMNPTDERIYHIYYAFKLGLSVEDVHKHSKIDSWFLDQLYQVFEIEQKLRIISLDSLDYQLLKIAKEAGFSDHQIGHIMQVDWKLVDQRCKELDIHTVYRLVDTCAAEFEAKTPYYYSSYGHENEVVPSSKKKIMILGGGPNRIGQGIEFDYCCVHASYALREIGYESVMVNSNPETVSTDYDTSDRLYFEPLTLEDTLEVYHQEGCSGAIVQFGGQTPLNLANKLKENGVNIIGTPPESIDAAEDREIFKQIIEDLGLKQPESGIAFNKEDVYKFQEEIGFPILLRPSFVLGGRGMYIIYDKEYLNKVLRKVFDAAEGKPVLVDRYLENAIELDVDCISDGHRTVIGGVLEHIEYAGVHSGDAGMVLPAHTLSDELLEEIRVSTYALAEKLKVVGLMNVQYAIKDDQLYVLEVNPRASRTVPFISKAINVPLAKYATRVMLGETLEDIGFTEQVVPKHWAVKQSVFPFIRFPGTAIALGPEMRSTGEVMGIDDDLGFAFAKSQMAVHPLPLGGNVFFSVKDSEKEEAVEIARDLIDCGFKIFSTSGTADKLKSYGLDVTTLYKLHEGGRPTVIDMIKNDEMDMIVNTPSGTHPLKDENKIRKEAIAHSICVMPTLLGLKAAIEGIKAMQKKNIQVKSIQDFFK